VYDKFVDMIAPILSIPSVPATNRLASGSDTSRISICEITKSVMEDYLKRTVLLLITYSNYVIYLLA